MRHLSVLILSIQLIKNLDRNDETYESCSLSWYFCNLKLVELQVQKCHYRNCQFCTFFKGKEVLAIHGADFVFYEAYPAIFTGFYLFIYEKKTNFDVGT